MAFGLVHLSNIFVGASIGAAVAQAENAMVVGLVFGYYYERTRNYVGTALLHNIYDLAVTIAPAAVALIK